MCLCLPDTSAAEAGFGAKPAEGFLNEGGTHRVQIRRRVRMKLGFGWPRRTETSTKLTCANLPSAAPDRRTPICPMPLLCPTEGLRTSSSARRRYGQSETAAGGADPTKSSSGMRALVRQVGHVLRGVARGLAQAPGEPTRPGFEKHRPSSSGRNQRNGNKLGRIRPNFQKSIDTARSLLRSQASRSKPHQRSKLGSRSRPAFIDFVRI